MVTGIIILLPCLCLLVWLLLPSDEEQIRTQLEELCEIASKTEDASAISDAMVVKDFRKLFAPKITITIINSTRLKPFFFLSLRYFIIVSPACILCIVVDMEDRQIQLHHYLCCKSI